jgi:hypothetical protein
VSASGGRTNDVLEALVLVGELDRVITGEPAKEDEPEDEGGLPCVVVI